MTNHIIKSSFGNFNVSLEARNFKEKDIPLLEASVSKMARALGSDNFEDFCLRYSYKSQSCTGYWWWKKCKSIIHKSFRWNKELCRKEIYDKLMSGKETLSPDHDNEADVFLSLDKKNKKGVLGYTYPSTNWQWIYNWFFKTGNADSIAGNIAHEWCHKMGFGHERKYNSLRSKTVPYAVGYFVRDF